MAINFRELYEQMRREALAARRKEEEKTKPEEKYDIVPNTLQILSDLHLEFSGTYPFPFFSVICQIITNQI